MTERIQRFLVDVVVLLWTGLIRLLGGWPKQAEPAVWFGGPRPTSIRAMIERGNPPLKKEAR